MPHHCGAAACVQAGRTMSSHGTATSSSSAHWAQRCCGAPSLRPAAPCSKDEGQQRGGAQTGVDHPAIPAEDSGHTMRGFQLIPISAIPVCPSGAALSQPQLWSTLPLAALRKAVQMLQAAAGVVRRAQQALQVADMSPLCLRVPHRVSACAYAGGRRPGLLL